MKTPFQAQGLRKRSLLSKIFKIPAPDIARQAIANLLVENQPDQLSFDAICSVLGEYGVNQSQSRSVLLQVYEIAVNRFLEDVELDKAEYEYLRNLSLLLQLSSEETNHILQSCALPIFQGALQLALSRRDSTYDVKKRIGRLQEKLQLDEQTSLAIYTNAARDIAQEKFDAIVSSKRFTSNEDAQLTAIQNTLGITIDFDHAAQTQLGRYRLFSEIEGGRMPIVSTDVKLQRGEHCHFVAPAEWHELRSQTVRTEYSGITGSHRIAKGVYFRTGLVAVNRIKRDVLLKVDTGEIYITNKRTLFRGQKGNHVILHRNLLAINVFSDAIKLEKFNGKSPFLLINGDIELAAIILTTWMAQATE